MSKIKKQLVSGTIFLAIAKYSGVFINIFVIAILARLVAPKDFAVVTIITIFSNFFVMFSEFGIAAAIVQNQKLTRQDINNIFSYCCYLGLILGFIFFFCSQPISSFYNDSLIKSLIKILSVQVLFSSLNIVPNALILKAKEFKFISLRTIIIHLITGTGAIVAALNGFGVYSLLINPVCSAIILFMINYLKVGTLKFSFFPQYKRLSKVLNYSVYNLFYNVINYFSRNIDKLIIGKKISLTELGYYDKSYALMMLPIQNLVSVINPVIHPVLSEYQSDSKLIYEYLLKCVKLFAWIGFPLSSFVFFYSSYIIIFFLGDNWEPAIGIFQIFSLSIAFQLIYSLQGPFFLIRNAPKYMMFCGIITMLLNIIALLIGLFIFNTLYGVAYMIDLSYLLTFLITFYVLQKKCFESAKFHQIVSTLIPPIIICLLYIVAMFATEFMLKGTFLIVGQIIISLGLISYTLGKVYKLIRK